MRFYLITDEKAIRKHNPELDEEGVRDTLHNIEESNFPFTRDHIDTNEKIQAKLIGLSRSGGLEPITVTQYFGEGNVEKTVRLFNFNPENNDFLVTNQFQLEGLKESIFPDIVIVVNGIPLVTMECKSPDKILITFSSTVFLILAYSLLLFSKSLTAASIFVLF